MGSDELYDVRNFAAKIKIKKASYPEMSSQKPELCMGYLNTKHARFFSAFAMRDC